MLPASMLYKCETISFYGMVKSISFDAFTNLKVKIVYFNVQKLVDFLKISTNWISSFKQGLVEIVINSEENFYFYETDLCYFSKMPQNKFHLLSITQFHSYNKCECTMVALFKNYFYLHNISFDFKLSRYGIGTFNGLLTIGCFNQVFIDQCNLDQKLKLCQSKKLNFNSTWQEIFENSQYIELISILISESISLIGLVLNTINLIVLKSIISDQSFTSNKFIFNLKLMFLNSLINFFYLLINILHLINRCVSLNGIFCSKILKTKFSQIFDIYVVEYFGNVLKLWSAISLIAVSITRLKDLSHQLKNHVLVFKLTGLVFFIFSAVINIDKLFYLQINESLDLMEWNENQEFPERNTFLLKFIQDRRMSREIYYEGSKSLIFYILLVTNFFIHDIVFLFILTFFDLYVLKVFLFKMNFKKKLALRLKFSKTKISKIEFSQIKFTIIILGNAMILFFLRALHLYINTQIFIIKLKPNHSKKNICFAFSKVCTNNQEASEILNILSNSYNFFLFYLLNKNFKIKFWIFFKKIFD